MLQTMRSSAKFVFWILAVAFIGGFLLVETSGLLGRTAVTPTTAVASVNGRDILYTDWQRRSQQLQQQQQQQSGGRAMTQDEVRAIENQSFDEMVAEVLLEQEYRKRGIVVSDAELRDYARFAPPPWVQSAPDLQTDGRFDAVKYQRLLGSAQARQSGLLVALEQYFRTEVPKEKLFEQVTSGLFVTDAELWRSWQDANDSAQASFVAFHPAPTDADRNVSDGDLKSYYEAHRSEFDRPARAVLSVLHLPRTVTAADSAAVRARIGQLRAEIAGGAKFEDVAKRESVDSATAGNGGELKGITRGQLVPEFEKAAFSLKPGQLSEPVLTQFGWHLIKEDARRGDTLDLRHILLKVAPSDSTTARVDREADQLAKLAAGADQPAKFDAAAKALGLTAFKVTASEGEPAQAQGRYIPSVSAWAFNGPRIGESSDLFDAEDGYYVARLDSLQEGGKTFGAVKDAVRERVASMRALDRIMPTATQLATAARSSSLEAAAAAAKLPVSKTAFTTRGGMAREYGSLGEAVGATFGLPLNTVSAPIRQMDGVFVIRVDARKPADKAAFEAAKSALRARRMEALRRQRVQLYLDDLRKTATIKDMRKEINAQIRRQSTT
ncbi:MAG: peptidyl-prolyl cis-trans isomerase [Gemmatimonadetes bacterium]|nr:peptidyl-prolyl cis-trans isomerase [Gemmatimonadota bacterium]